MDILPSPPLPILSLWAYAHSPAVTDMMKEALQLPAMRRVKGEVAIGGFAGATERLRLKDAAPDVLVIEAAEGIDQHQLENDIRLLASVCERAPELFVIGHLDSARHYRVVKDIGGADYLVMPTTARELVSRLGRPFAGLEAGNGTTVAVYGARGGAGASTVAAHLAQILAGRSEQRTALVDLALPFGGLATSLKVDFDRDAAARIYSPSTIDTDVLNRMSYKVAGNLWLVPCPPDVGGELTDNTQGRKALMHLLRAEFRASVLDLPRDWSWAARDTLEYAEHVVLVVAGDHAGVMNAQAIVRHLQIARDGMAPLRVVINHAGRPGDWSEKDIAAALAIKPSAVIRSDPKTVLSAAAHGRLLKEDGAHKLFGRALAQLAAELDAEPAAAPRGARLGRGVLRRLLSAVPGVARA